MSVPDIQHSQWRYDTRNNLMSIQDEDAARQAAIVGAGLFSVAERLGSIDEAIRAQTAELKATRESHQSYHATVYNFKQDRRWRFSARYRRWRRKLKKLMRDG